MVLYCYSTIYYCASATVLCPCPLRAARAVPARRVAHVRNELQRLSLQGMWLKNTTASSRHYLKWLAAFPYNRHACLHRMADTVPLLNLHFLPRVLCCGYAACAAAGLHPGERLAACAARAGEVLQATYPWSRQSQNCQRCHWRLSCVLLIGLVVQVGWCSQWTCAQRTEYSHVRLLLQYLCCFVMVGALAWLTVLLLHTGELCKMHMCCAVLGCAV